MNFYTAKIFFYTLIFCAVVASTGCTSSGETARNTEKDLNIFAFVNTIEQATFTSLEGDTVRISDFKGKVVMIDFWETWCKPCLQSFPTMQKVIEEHPENFVVLAVTPGWRDDRDDARDFAEDHDYDFRYLMDTNELHKKIGVQGIPYKVFLDKNGNFIKTSVGSRGPKEDYKRLKAIVSKYGK